MSLQRRKGLWQVRSWKLTDKQIAALLDHGLLILKYDARTAGLDSRTYTKRFLDRAEASK